MSNFYKNTRHPCTGEWMNAAWLDNYFGHRSYGVKFGEYEIFNADNIHMRTRPDNNICGAIEMLDEIKTISFHDKNIPTELYIKCNVLVDKIIECLLQENKSSGII